MVAALPIAFAIGWIGLALRYGWRTQLSHPVDFGLGLVTAVIVNIPQIGYAVEYPEKFFFRQIGRLTGSERPIEGSVPAIIVNNIARVLQEFHWLGDEVYVATIAGRPVVDPIVGALLVVGTVVAVATAIRRRDLVPIAVMAALFVMLLPSALNLSFPRENPSAGRSAGAAPAVYALAALPVALWTVALLRSSARVRYFWATGLGLIALSLIVVNAYRQFDVYALQYCQRVHNESDAAAAIKAAIADGVPPENALVVAYEYWYDTRLVGMWLGDLDWRGGIWWQQLPEKLPAQAADPRPRVYIVNPGDQQSLAAIRRIYPTAVERRQKASRCDTGEFVVVRVPGRPVADGAR